MARSSSQSPIASSRSAVAIEPSSTTCRPSQLDPETVEGDELLGRHAVLGQLDEGREHVLAGSPQRLDGPQRGGRGVVDLVGQSGGERAQRHQRLALAGGGVDAADGLVHAGDHVLAER